MSQENAEIVRALIDSWNRDDLDGALAATHAEFVIRLAGVFPGFEPTYRGHEGLREWWASFREPWQELTVELVRLTDLGGERVLAEIKFHARGRDGIAVERPAASLWRVRSGAIIEFRTFGEWDEAMREAGAEPGPE
jgi:ketosteroid isomerase-like protein